MSTIIIFICLFLCVIGNLQGLATSNQVKDNYTPRTSNRILSKKYKNVIESEALIAKSTFKIKPSSLIERCKQVADNGVGINNPDDLAEDFVFQFPYIGPLSKQRYLDAVRSFKIETVFPDANAGFYDFRLDPFQPNRVWYSAVFLATHTGETKFFGKATGKVVETPPQAMSLTFNEEGKVVRYTGGYVMDRTLGNTGGLGGLFGPLYRIGKGFPFPEGRPWKPSIQFRVYNTVTSFLAKFVKP